MHHELDWSKISYTEHTITLTGGDDMALPPSPRRIGLILPPSANGSTVRYSLAQQAVSASVGISIPGASPPMVLFGPQVRFACSGPVRVNGSAGQTVTVAEWLYGD